MIVIDPKPLGPYRYRYPNWRYDRAENYDSHRAKQWSRWKHAPASWLVLYDLTLEEYLKNPDNPGFEWFARTHVYNMPPTYNPSIGAVNGLYGITAEEMLDVRGDVLKTGKRIFYDTGTFRYSSGGVWFVPIQAEKGVCWVARNLTNDPTLNLEQFTQFGFHWDIILIELNKPISITTDAVTTHSPNYATHLLVFDQFTIQGKLYKHADPFTEPQYAIQGIEGLQHEAAYRLCLYKKSAS